MRSHPRIMIAAAMFGCVAAPAQSVGPADPPDAVVEAILKARDRSKPNEVTVVLDPPAREASPLKPLDGSANRGANPGVAGAGERAGEWAVRSVPAEAGEGASPGLAPEPEEGPAVRVETLRGAAGPVDPAQVQLDAPFPAKPLAKPPVGWKLEAPRDVPEFTREVEIAPGAFVTLSIRPHLLTPSDDGRDVIAVREPGFDPALGYRQERTVGAALASSLENLEKDARQIGDAIERLQQLLVSLPTPEPAEPAP